jgi:hypothetical protein
MPESRSREARKTVRRTTRRSAEVMFPGKDRPIPCVILDLSSGGARLAIGYSSAEIPHTFALVLYKDRSAQRECEIVWTDRRCVGVKFISAWHAPTRPEWHPQATKLRA